MLRKFGLFGALLYLCRWKPIQKIVGKQTQISIATKLTKEFLSCNRGFKKRAPRMEKINYISLCCVAQPIGAQMFADTLYPFEANARVSANADGLDHLADRFRNNNLLRFHVNKFIGVRNLSGVVQKPILGVLFKKRGNPKATPNPPINCIDATNIRQ